MINLDNPEEIKKYDPKDVYGSTGFFIDQCRQIHEIVESYNFNHNYENIKNIVFSGMGGSAYGAHIVSSLFKDNLSLPAIYINSDYNLPGFVDPDDTLVFLTSYSGGTEETISSFNTAKAVGCKMTGLTTGGNLAGLLSENKNDFVKFDPKYNPSGQPRLGTGYIILGTIEMLKKMKLLSITSKEILNAVDDTDKNKKEIQKTAKDLAKKIYGKIPVIFAASHLSGNAHVIRNQFNETAKSFAGYNILPELNHHLMEGLKNPTNKNLATLFLESDFYPERIKKRLSLTREVVQKNNIEILYYKALGKSQLGQSLELLLLGGYLTFYLAILYGQDPSIIPWVDYFKEKLAQE